MEMSNGYVEQPKIIFNSKLSLLYWNKLIYKVLYCVLLTKKHAINTTPSLARHPIYNFPLRRKYRCKKNSDSKVSKLRNYQNTDRFKIVYAIYLQLGRKIHQLCWIYITLVAIFTKKKNHVVGKQCCPIYHDSSNSMYIKAKLIKLFPRKDYTSRIYALKKR